MSEHTVWGPSHVLFTTFFLVDEQLQSDLLLDEGHDADPGEDRLPTQALPRHAVRERLRSVGHRLAQVTHKEGHVRSGEEGEAEGKKCGQRMDRVYNWALPEQHGSSSLEFFLGFAPEVSDQPLRGERVLRRHPPPHHCIQEGLSLPCVKSQHLQMEIATYFRFSRRRLALSENNASLFKSICILLLENVRMRRIFSCIS